MSHEIIANKCVIEFDRSDIDRSNLNVTPVKVKSELDLFKEKLIAKGIITDDDLR